MTLSYEEAVAVVTAPGQLLEVTTAKVRGIDYRVFAHAPGSLRDLFALARTYGDKTFLVYEDETWSFAQVMERVDALGALLVDTYGIRPGDRVAIGMRNFPEWIMAFAAITSIGAISVSLNAWWSADELEYGLTDSGTAVLIADAQRVGLSHDACVANGIRVLAVRAGADLPDDVDRWEDVLPLGAALPEVAIDTDDDATILYTSGTTGRPKGAVSSHRAVIQALFGFACRTYVERARDPERAAAGPEPTDSVFILIVPLFHVTGSVPVMMACFALGMKLVMMYRWDPERALQLIEREGVTNFVGVPTQSWDLLECPHFAAYDTSSLRSVGGGGAPAPPALVSRVVNSFQSGMPSIGYGMTETNAYGPGHTGIDYVSHPTSTGRATPILQIAIRDAAGADVATGASGEIWLKGPNVFRGYWNKPEATAQALVEGWMRTGDLGRLDEEGFLYVEDRLKDMILRAGENVYCAEVEAAIYEHPAVHEAAVFGVPHERLGEEVAAVVVPKPGLTVTPEEITTHVAARLARFKAPTLVTVAPELLPRNAAGKILKRELRDRFAR
jgi:long-chain acyl-CoA synthetase